MSQRVRKKLPEVTLVPSVTILPVIQFGIINMKLLFYFMFVSRINNGPIAELIFPK